MIFAFTSFMFVNPALKIFVLRTPIFTVMEASNHEWKIVFDGTQIYHVKSNKACTRIIILALLLLLVPIVVLVITYLAIPCFLLGHSGKLKNG